MLKTKAGREAFSIRHLLSAERGVKHLLEYIHGTRRFEQTFGRLWSERDEEDEDEQERLRRDLET